MLTVIYRKYGDPRQVLEVEEVPEPAGPAADEVLIRVVARPVHPGDLLGVAGAYRSPGDTSEVGPAGARPGFEGTGKIEAIGSSVDPSSGLKVGARVAYFPVRGAWGERVIAPAAFVTVVPDDVADVVAAQLHVNPLTAALLFRATEAAGVGPDRESAVVLTAAGSAVAKLVTALARRRGLAVINVVRSSDGRDELLSLYPDVPVVSSDEPDWRDQMKAAANGKPIRAVLDPVGGDIATNMIALLAGGGTLISYGDLSGLPIRVPALSFSVRDIRIHGVSVGRWAGLHESVRTEDIRTAIELARHEPALFAVAACYGLADIRRAADHAQQAGKRGTVLLTSPSN